MSFTIFTQILKSYTLDDCEAPIKPAFIEKLTVKLNERSNKVRNVLSSAFNILNLSFKVK